MFQGQTQNKQFFTKIWKFNCNQPEAQCVATTTVTTPMFPLGRPTAAAILAIAGSADAAADIAAGELATADAAAATAPGLAAAAEAAAESTEGLAVAAARPEDNAEVAKPEAAAGAAGAVERGGSGLAWQVGQR